MQWREAAKRAADLLYPKICPVCARIIPGDGSGNICQECRKKLSYITGVRCLKCGKTIDDAAKQYCGDCARNRHWYRQGVGVWNYTKEIRTSVYAFKYHNQRVFAECYAREVQICCGDVIRNWHAQALVPVPMYAGKERRRGYNQAAILSEELSKILEIPSIELLVRARNTTPQKELDEKERVKNLERAFIIRQNVVEYKKIILVDDIYTTGTTIDACAKVLLNAGASEVFFIALCIGRGF